MPRPVVVVADMPLPLEAEDITGLGSAAFVDVPVSGDAAGDEAVLGSDSRLGQTTRLFEGIPVTGYTHSYGALNSVPSINNSSTLEGYYTRRLPARFGGPARLRGFGGYLLVHIGNIAVNTPSYRWKPGGSNAEGGATPNDRGIVIIDGVTNDYGYRNSTNLAELAGFQETLRLMLRWLKRAQGSTPVQGALWTPITSGGFPGGVPDAEGSYWFQPVDNTSDRGFITQSTAAAQRVRTSFSGNEFIIQTLRSNTGVGGPFTGLEIYNYDTGTLKATVNCAGGYVYAPGGVNFAPISVRTKDWGAGTHNVEVRSLGAVSFLDAGWYTNTLTGSDFPPEVFVVSDGATNQSVMPGGIDPVTAANNWAAAIEAVCQEAEFSAWPPAGAGGRAHAGYVHHVNMMALGWNRSTMVGADFVHPNDRGQAFYTDALEAAVRDAVPGYQEGVHLRA